jgi:hypothetical protein
MDTDRDDTVYIGKKPAEVAVSKGKEMITSAAGGAAANNPARIAVARARPFRCSVARLFRR